MNDAPRDSTGGLGPNGEEIGFSCDGCDLDDVCSTGDTCHGWRSEQAAEKQGAEGL